MTPQLQQAIHLVHLLSQTEQIELLRVLSNIIQKPDSLEAQNERFWVFHSLDQLIQEQKPPVITDLSSLKLDFWESDESGDEFLIFLRRQRTSEAIEML
ncbi:MAG: hypothetical protein SFY66_28555 [Oculatellaceae cyanobacterium bins.114]|nr:hypothetical protein [Oculatellaceae cyanobacterium bins.114]